MSTWVEITGQPKLEFEVTNLPSWNRIVGLHWSKYKPIKEDFYNFGLQMGLMLKDTLPEWMRDLVVVDRCLMVIKVFPPREGEKSDTHNVSIKAITDGLRDARIFEDDEWAYIPLVIFMWGGIDPNGDRTTIIEVHELEGLIINGESQILPCGRVRNDT